MNNLLQGVNVYLIGMMGAGKTTVGKLLAQKLGYRFFDTDVLLEKVAQKPIPEIFADKDQGEAYFRDLETKVLGEVSAYTRSAISTGGGIVEKPINWSYLRQGLVIWLDVEIEVLKERLAEDDTRPLAGKLESLWKSRRSLYAQADLQIAIRAQQTPEQIRDEIMDKIPEMIISQPRVNS
ncbi:MAG: shikimate kinase [Xenococcaceae cyanobacterium MO_207.B15]|nr:shikimate kinase [Xenococcaceae cyanobacterium MO_207.B15]MDJ0742891.1 shikimate kinase [Xenococcaceae cyanobacterium MO_167.B27]